MCEQYVFQWQTGILWAESRGSTKIIYWESLSNFQGVGGRCEKTEISQHKVSPSIVFVGVGKGCFGKRKCKDYHMEKRVAADIHSVTPMWRFCAKPLIVTKPVSRISPFYRCRRWEVERLDNLFTQLKVAETVSYWTQGRWLWAQHLVTVALHPGPCGKAAERTHAEKYPRMMPGAPVKLLWHEFSFGWLSQQKGVPQNLRHVCLFSSFVPSTLYQALDPNGPVKG